MILPRSGHTLCVACQLPISKGGGESKALYIDTEAQASGNRIRSKVMTFMEPKGQNLMTNFDFENW